MVLVLLVSVLFRPPFPFLIVVGGKGGWGGIKMASASTPSANEPAKDLVLVHTVQLISLIKANFSERMVSSSLTYSPP